MNPFESIWDDRPAATTTIVKTAPKKPAKVTDHSAARAVWERCRARLAELAPLRVYAKAVVVATAGPSMTPVAPLATMSKGGGPLLCDHCGKPMILEGGRFNKVPVDRAWQENTGRAAGWVSYISGGMVVEIATNGTLRIYHGYIGRNPDDCCNAAKARDDAADAAFSGRITSSQLMGLFDFLRAEFPDALEREVTDMANEVVNTLFTYDPGDGINRP